MQLQEGKKSPHVDRNKGCATHTVQRETCAEVQMEEQLCACTQNPICHPPLTASLHAVMSTEPAELQP